MPSDGHADEAPHCPVCGEVSDVVYRCSECGKLFDDGAQGRDAGRSVVGGGR